MSEEKKTNKEPPYRNVTGKDGKKYSVLRNGFVLCTSPASTLGLKKEKATPSQQSKS